MKSAWVAFKVICILQIVFSGLMLIAWIHSLTYEHKTLDYAAGLPILAGLALPIFAIRMLSRKFPEKSFSLTQKWIHTVLSVINIVLVAFLLLMLYQMIVEAGEEQIEQHEVITTSAISLIAAIAVFQTLILIGLFRLRRRAAQNAAKEIEFEFEDQ